MSTPDPLAEPIARDWRGRPLITPVGGGKPVGYTRCTTYVGCLEDTTNLSKWSQRMVATGLAKRPDLLLAVSAHNGDSKADKQALNKVCEEAREAAAASAAATTGTALHRLAERLDNGETVDVPAAAQADLDAYQAATRGMVHRHIEVLTVNDELKVAGTPDRISRYAGKLVIADLKTGTLDWGIGKIAMQLAVYAHSALYDTETHERRPIDGIDLKQALVIHLPAGTGTCNLVWVDIEAGWQAVQLAREVRAWRARKDLATPASTYVGADVFTLIERAQSIADLEQIWLTHSDAWSHELTQRAAKRKAEISAAA